MIRSESVHSASHSLVHHSRSPYPIETSPPSIEKMSTPSSDSDSSVQNSAQEILNKCRNSNCHRDNNPQAFQVSTQLCCRCHQYKKRNGRLPTKFSHATRKATNLSRKLLSNTDATRKQAKPTPKPVFAPKRKIASPVSDSYDSDSSISDSSSDPSSTIDTPRTRPPKRKAAELSRVKLSQMKHLLVPEVHVKTEKEESKEQIHLKQEWGPEWTSEDHQNGFKKRKVEVLEVVPDVPPPFDYSSLRVNINLIKSEADITETLPTVPIKMEPIIPIMPYSYNTPIFVEDYLI